LLLHVGVPVIPTEEPFGNIKDGKQVKRFVIEIVPDQAFVIRPLGKHVINKLKQFTPKYFLIVYDMSMMDYFCSQFTSFFFFRLCGHAR
jgi:hypothetical protein